MSPEGPQHLSIQPGQWWRPARYQHQTSAHTAWLTFQVVRSGNVDARVRYLDGTPGSILLRTIRRSYRLLTPEEVQQAQLTQLEGL